jgi:ABC-type nitrate/sulfonate/bicarbonate transport system permease component
MGRKSPKFRTSIMLGVGLLVLLLVWELSVCTPAHLPKLYRLPFLEPATCDGARFTLFSKPSEILRIAIQTNILRSRLLGHFLVTLQNSFCALMLTIALCCTWYYFASLWPFVRRTGFTLAWVLQVIPYVAIAWMLAIIFRPVDKIVFGFVVASFPMFGALIDALKKIPQSDREVLLLYGSSHYLRFRHLFAPFAANEFFIGCALAAPLSVVGVLIADFTGGETVGLGQDILIASRNVKASELWLATLLAIFISCFLTMLVYLFEVWFAATKPWYQREIDDGSV